MVERIGLRTFFSPGFEQAVANGRMSQEQMDKQLEALTTGRTSTFIKALFASFGFIYLPIALILVGVCKLITMLVAGENKFKPIFSVTIYTFLAIGIITTLLTVIVLFLKSPEELDPNNLIGSNLAALLALFLDKDSLPKFIMGLARWVDVFAIWTITLLSIGYAVVSRGVKTSTMAMGLGVFYILFALLMAALSSLRG
jgi:Yip1 domain